LTAKHRSRLVEPAPPVDRNVDWVLRHAERVLEATAQVGVAEEHACIAELPIDVRGNRDLVVAEEIAEDERRAAGKVSIIRRIAD
jgi:hypothetical protein